MGDIAAPSATTPGQGDPANTPPEEGSPQAPTRLAVWDDYGRLQIYGTARRTTNYDFLNPAPESIQPELRNLYDDGPTRRIKQVVGAKDGNANGDSASRLVSEVLYVTPDFTVTLFPQDDQTRPIQPQEGNSYNNNLLTDTRVYSTHVLLDGQRVATVQQGAGLSRPKCLAPGGITDVGGQASTDAYLATWYATDHLGSTELQTDLCGNLIRRCYPGAWKVKL